MCIFYKLYTEMINFINNNKVLFMSKKAYIKFITV